MLKRTLAAVLSAAFFVTATAAIVIAPVNPAAAEMAAKPEPKKKELTPQQQKMKDCAAKWGEAKKADSNLKGRKAYNDFMSKCLKG
jgi:psiF repeat-containing protein